VTGDGEKISDRLEAWARQDGARTIGSLIETFGRRSFAVLFIVLLAFSAIPLPTGGISQVFEFIAILLALELIAGRTEVWVPRRWMQKTIKGVGSPRFVNAMARRIRWLERFTRPRLAGLVQRRISSRLFGVAVLAFCLGAVLAPPFSGLDTLPSMGVVLVSLGMLLDDALVILVGTVVGAAGLLLIIGLGQLIVNLF
jgi:hypothetical protein